MQIQTSLYFGSRFVQSSQIQVPLTPKTYWSPTTKLNEVPFNSCAGPALQTQGYKNRDLNYLLIEAESKFTCLNLNKMKSAQPACKYFPLLNKILRASVFFSIALTIYRPKIMRKIYKVQSFNINLHCYSFTGSCKIHKLLIPRTHPYLQRHIPSAKMQRSSKCILKPHVC